MNSFNVYPDVDANYVLDNFPPEDSDLDKERIFDSWFESPKPRPEAVLILTRIHISGYVCGLEEKITQEFQGILAEQELQDFPDSMRTWAIAKVCRWLNDSPYLPGWQVIANGPAFDVVVQEGWEPS